MHAVERVADRHRVQHDTTGANRMIATGRKCAGDVAVGDAGTGDVDVDRIRLAGGTAGRKRQHHRLKLYRSVVLGEIDSMAHRLFDLRQIDHRTGLHAARLGVANAENLDAVGTPAQRVLRTLRFESRNQADDLAGADVQPRDDGRTARRHRPHLRGEAVMEAHAAPPFFFGLLALSASARAAAASSDNCTVTRSSSRRSIAAMSRLRMLLSRSSLTSVSSARSTSISGRRTAMPFLSMTFQRRSATRTAAWSWSRIAGYLSSSARKSLARVSAPTPTTNGSWAKCWPA